MKFAPERVIITCTRRHIILIYVHIWLTRTELFRVIYTTRYIYGKKKLLTLITLIFYFSDKKRKKKRDKRKTRKTHGPRLGKKKLYNEDENKKGKKAKHIYIY